MPKRFLNRDRPWLHKSSSPQVSRWIIPASLLMGASGAVLSSFITGAFPLPDEPMATKIEKIQKITGAVVVDSLLTLIGSLVVSA